MKRIHLVMLVACLLTNSYSFAQQKPKTIAKVGDILEDYTFTDLANYPKKTASYSDFRGKWLVLDVWSIWCSGCIASFPKMDTLHQKFKDKVQFFMVGSTKDGPKTNVLEREKSTKRKYSELQREYRLSIPVAFDSVFMEKYDIYSLPHIIIANPEGKVVAVTRSIDSIKLKALIEGKTPKFETALTISEMPKYDNKLPLLTTGKDANGGADTSFLFRSLLVPGDERMQSWSGIRTLDTCDFRSTKILISGRLECILFPLQNLYNLAFFGSSLWTTDHELYKIVHPRIIFETKDEKIIDLFNPLNTFSYSLKVPPAKSSAKFLMEVMRNDFNNYFDFDVRKENRKLPVWSFEIDDLDKVRSHGTKASVPIKTSKKLQYPFGFRAVNKNADELVQYISHFAAIYKTELPLINNTGLDMRVDFEIEANTMDLEAVNKDLKKIGFRIVKSEKEMKCLVVYDRK